MFKHYLSTWVRAGIANYPHENFTPIRVTNILAAIVIFVLLCQLPGALWYWQERGNYQCLIVLLSCGLLGLVPWLSVKQHYLQARILLILIYAANLLVTAWLWQENLYIHFFNLLAVLCCPFLFSSAESGYKWLFSSMFVWLFIASEGYYQSHSQDSLSEAQQWFKFSSAILLAMASLLCSFHIQKNITRSWQKLANEKKRSEQLLLNILPLSVAQRLKDSPHLIADYFSQASILFADIQNFTPLCKTRSPRQLVELLNELFCRFDTLALRYGLEKIKTNGDGYMAACGLPNANAFHAIQCCECALDMQHEFDQFSQRYALQTGLKIGIGCGEVVAGVIGKNKFSYDMWGEAVNLASRMESHGLGHKIQTTQSTYELTKHLFNFVKRGQINVKGVGQVTTYWLLSRKH